MKKILFIFLIACLFFSCNEGNFIDNKSSYDVKFTFTAKPAEINTVLSGKSFEVKAIRTGSELISFESKIPKRVGYTQTSYYNGYFFDLTFMPVIINNTLSYPVNLSAGGYLEIDPMFNIPTGENNTNTIYTTTPTLTVTTSTFPASADFQVINNTMYIVIK